MFCGILFWSTHWTFIVQTFPYIVSFQIPHMQSDLSSIFNYSINFPFSSREYFPLLSPWLYKTPVSFDLSYSWLQKYKLYVTRWYILFWKKKQQQQRLLIKEVNLFLRYVYPLAIFLWSSTLPSTYSLKSLAMMTTTSISPNLLATLIRQSLKWS